ncbi:MAG: HEAT repeat domain-containing protein, partial [Candidatus Binatia bacterium]
VWWKPPSPRDGSLARSTWWLLALGTYAFVLVVFRAQLMQRAFVLFPLPVIAIIVLLLINARTRRREGSGFLAAVAALGIGVATPILPWSLYFLGHLGFHGFLRDVLLIGTSYERFFFVGFRPVGTVWDVGLLAVGAGLLLVPEMVRRRFLPAWLPLAGLLVAGAGTVGSLALFAPMRSGVVSAVTTRVHDLSFFLLLIVNWSAVWLALRVTARIDDPRQTVAHATLVALIISAPAFTLGMYPRSDFAHLIAVAPVAIVLGVVLLGRLGERWRAMPPEGASWRGLGPFMLAAPVAVIAVVMCVPSVRLASDMTARRLGWRGPDALTALDLPHASLVREAEAGHQLDVLRETTTYLASHSNAHDYVFPFPNLSLLCFLAGRLNPTPKCYFIAGYPDHEAEAGIVQALSTRPPRLIVALREHELFVTTAPMYYFLVRAALQRDFAPATQIGPYVVMTRRDEVVDAFIDPAAQPADVQRWADLDNVDPLAKVGTAHRIRAARDAEGAVALVTRIAEGDTTLSASLVPMAGEFGDERAIPALVKIVTAVADDPSRAYEVAVAAETATDALYFLVEKAVLADYWFVPPPADRRRAVASELDAAVLKGWLGDRDADPRLRMAAAWAAAWRDDHDAIPHLLVMLGSSNLEVAKLAAYALVRLGQVEGTVESLVALLHWDDLTMPSLLLDLYRRAPEQARPAVERGLRTGTLQERVALTWVAAASGDRQLLPVLSEVRDDDAVGDGLRRITGTAITVLEGERQGAGL